jgi:hypothetical protein
LCPERADVGLNGAATGLPRVPLYFNPHDFKAFLGMRLFLTSSGELTKVRALIQVAKP